MSLKLSNNFEFDFACASGALAFDGRGWPWEWPLRWLGLIDPSQLVVVAKTITVEPRKGNLRWWCPWRCVWFAPFHGFVNAVGLTNGGLKWWLGDPYHIAIHKGYKLAASVWPTSTKDSEVFVDRLNPLRLQYVELNLSCPNTDDGVTQYRGLLEPFDHLDHPLVLKVSYAQAMDSTFLKMLYDYNVEAIHAINTVPWSVIYGDRPSPVKNWTGVEGGVSGPPIKQYALQAIQNIKALTKLQVVGGGGIETLRDVLDFEKVGANAFSIGSLFLKRPWRPRRIIAEYRRMQENQGTKGFTPK